MSPEQLVLLLFAAAFWTLMVTLLDDRHRKSLQVYSGALGGWRHLPWWNCRLAYVGGAGEGNGWAIGTAVFALTYGSRYVTRDEGVNYRPKVQTELRRTAGKRGK
jgi:hypothetical protein